MITQRLPGASNSKNPSTESSSGDLDSILRCLVALERDGIALEPREDGRKCRFHAGVPEALVQGWTRLSGDEFNEAIWTLERRNLISVKMLDSWPYLKNMVLRHEDGRSFVVRCWTRGDEQEAVFQVSVEWPSETKAPPELERPAYDSQVAVWAIPPAEGQMTRSIIRHYSPGVGAFFSVQRAGIELLEQGAPSQKLDPLVTLDQITALTRITKRTLERHLRAGKLPRPEYPGGDGKAHKWHWSSIREPLSAVCNRVLPLEFPGGRLI